MAEDIVIRVTVEDVNEKPADTPAEVQDGYKWIKEHVEGLGYEDVHIEYTKNPRMTDEGKLYAQGSFAGPPPNDGDERSPEDFAEYHFNIVESKDYEKLYLIEVHYKHRHLATFEIGSEKLKCVQGDIAHI